MSNQEFSQCTPTDIYEHGSTMGLDIYDNANAFLSGKRSFFRADLQTSNPKHKVAEIVLFHAIDQASQLSWETLKDEVSTWNTHTYHYVHTLLAQQGNRQIIETIGSEFKIDDKTGVETEVISDHIQYAGVIALSSADQA